MALRDPVTAHIAVGANLGDAMQAVQGAITCLGTLPGTQLTRRSSLYRTAPLEASGPDFINAVAEISTRLSAPELLDSLQAIEQAAGRERPYRNAPRTLDLDLLLYGQARIDSPRLQVPHPRMAQRAFVLVPLAEIAPQLVSREQLVAVAGQAIERVSPQ
jgi:2-amino-4-hydroxy-6-hydroxymethyldihydropteridine diphosphokinase